jgi:hypothetical protein
MPKFTGYFPFAKASVAGGYPLASNGQAGHPVPTPDPGTDDRESTGQFVLSQNFPNPYTDQTTIPFVLAFAADVQLSLFDLLGRKVAGIIRLGLMAGEHHIQLNLCGLGLAAGTYVYQLRITNRYGVFRQSRLMTAN